MKKRIALLDSKASNQLHKKNIRPIIVIGDLMLDAYMEGSVNKISVESPVPILLNPTIDEYYIGGSGNVAHNLTSLGNEVILIAGIGCSREGILDKNAQILKSLIEDAKISTKWLIPLERRTTVKKRIIGNKQQLLRIDEEDTDELSEKEESSFIEALESQAKSASAIVVSDYAKGIITKNLARAIQTAALTNKIPLIADLKPKTAELFSRADIIKSNIKESITISGLSYNQNFDTLDTIASKLSKRFDARSVITCGNKGIVTCDINGICTHIAGKAKEVFDVTGAGDTVTAALAHGYVRGVELEDNAAFAIIAASVAISRKHIVAVNMHEVEAELSKIIMPKTWGHEEWIVNSEYCGKKLVLNEGHCCSLHYHKIKDETFYIASGRVGFQLNDEYFILNPGDSLLITPGTKHRFYGLENSEIFEFSTHHLEEDSYRDEVSGTFEKSFFNNVPNYNTRKNKMTDNDL